MINSVTEVQEGTILEVVLNTQPLGDEDVEIRPHSLSIHSYKTPTFCDFCREMLFGMFKQVIKYDDLESRFKNQKKKLWILILF